MNIFKAMIPQKVFDSVLDIPDSYFEELKNQGVKCVLLDYDNTIDIDRSVKPSEYSRKCIDFLTNKGFSCCLVSNAKSERSSNIAKELGLCSVNCAHKPRTSGVFRALDMMGVKSHEAVMIGDQIFTDVMAGNLSGCHTIMVEKYQPKEVWYVSIKRPMERIIRFFCKF